MTKNLYEIVDCGITDYEENRVYQKQLFKQHRDGIIGDTLVVTRHEPTITMGKSADEQDLLVSKSSLPERGVAMYYVERGGGITYHDPGQIVLYPIFDLRGYHKDLREFVHRLGKTMMDSSKHFGLDVELRTGDQVGLWIAGQNKKLGSIGVHVKNWVTMHGLALNLDLDRSKSRLIRPCGLEDVQYVSLTDYVDLALAEVQGILLQYFERNFLSFRRRNE